MLTALAERLGCAVHLRGNEVLVEGPDDRLGRAAIVIEELGALVEQGLAIGPQTVEALGGVLDAGVSGADVLHDVVWRHRGKKIAPKTLNQKRYVDAIRRATVTFGIGPAGTGKTYLAMALAVAALVDREVSRIILTRPAVEAGEHLGFLPGDMQAKVDPYLRPLFDAVYDMLDADRLQTSLEKGLIEVAPLAFMRGRTLNDSFIILDEAQNTTPEQMQMFLTRLGFNSKMVVTGDVTQTDLKGGQRSGLVDVDRAPARHPRHRVRRVRQRGRRAPQARRAHRLGVQRARGGQPAQQRRAGRQRGSELSDVPADLVLQGVAEAGLDSRSVERLVQAVLDDLGGRGSVLALDLHRRRR